MTTTRGLEPPRKHTERQSHSDGSVGMRAHCPLFFTPDSGGVGYPPTDSPLRTESLYDPGSFPDVEYRFRHADSSWAWLYGGAINLLDDPDVGGIVAYDRDVTDLQDDDGLGED